MTAAQAEAGRDGPRILAISSRVAYGRVGLSAIEAVATVLGVEVVSVPTVTLSQHPGLGPPIAVATPPDAVVKMVQTLTTIGALDHVDTIITGYLPSAAHVAAAAEAVATARGHARGGARWICDPVLGDHPGGLYIPVDAAAAVRERLAPNADVLTPNRFELGWLTGARVDDLAATTEAARRLGPSVIVTSPPLPNDQAGAVVVEHGRADAEKILAEPIEGAPKGAGDAFCGLIAAGVAPGAAVDAMSRLIAASAGSDYLRIIEAAEVWAPTARMGGDGTWRSTSS